MNEFKFWRWMLQPPQPEITYVIKDELPGGPNLLAGFSTGPAGASDPGQFRTIPEIRPETLKKTSNSPEK